MDSTGQAWSTRVNCYTDQIFSQGHEGCYPTGRKNPGGDHSGEWAQTRLLHGPCPFNLYMCLAVERWLERVEEEDGVGITVKYK